MSTMTSLLATDSSPESILLQGCSTSQYGGTSLGLADNSPDSIQLTSDSTTSHSRAGQTTTQALTNSASSTRRSTAKRKKTFSREDRAMHSVIERHRRQSFNQLLSQLASNIPNESLSGKPSKGVVVRASIAHHAEQRQRALTASVEIRKLLAERADLLREVNTMRQRYNSRSGLRTLDREEEKLRQKDRQDIFDVETESFTQCITSRLDSTEREEDNQLRTFLQLEGEASGRESLSLEVPFTSPTPSQLTRFLEHIDNDMLRFMPT